jgi:hypothetical protein
MKPSLDKQGRVRVKGGKVVWQPDSLAGQPLKHGKQWDFLSAWEDFVGLDGGKGSGKTDLLIHDCLRVDKLSNPRWHGVIFRREYKRLTEVIDRATFWLNQIPALGAHWQGDKSRFVFPSGAWLAFHNVELLGDEEKYQGWEICDLKFDQLEEFLEPIFNYLVLLNRTTGKGLYPTVKWTANPIGVGRDWVKKRFIDGKKPGLTYNFDVEVNHKVYRRTYRRIFATVFDNPAYAEDERYIATLASEPNPYIRKAMFEGNWDVTVGMHFQSFASAVHVVPSVELDKAWNRLGGMDYGNVKVMHVLTRDYTGKIYVEWECASEPSTMRPGGETASEWGERTAKFMLDRSIGSRLKVIGDTNMWSATGRDVGTTKTPAAIIQNIWTTKFKEKSLPPPILVPVSKRATEEYRYRVACNEAIRDYLAYQSDSQGNITTEPRLLLLDRCIGLANQLGSLVTDPSDPLDIAQDQPDHHFDCYDDQTEILTDAGWKPFSQITMADEFATLSPSNDIVYQKPEGIIQKKHSGEMLEYKGNGLNFCVTSTHRMVTVGYRDWNVKKQLRWRLVPIQNLDKWQYVPKTGDWLGIRATNTIQIGGKDLLLGPFLKFLGFWLAEGCADHHNARRTRIIVDQKNRELLERFANSLPFVHSINGRQQNNYRLTISSKALWQWFDEQGLIGKHANGKFIPKWILALEQNFLIELFKGMMLGDGTFTKRGGRFYHTVSKKLADDFQELCFKLGMSTSIHSYQPKPSYAISSPQRIYRVTISKSRVIAELRKSRIKKIHYDGLVYCVAVPLYHTLYVRRQGIPMWSGNSFKMPFLELHPTREKKKPHKPSTETELLEQRVFKKKLEQLMKPKLLWHQR